MYVEMEGRLLKTYVLGGLISSCEGGTVGGACPLLRLRQATISSPGSIYWRSLGLPAGQAP